MPRHRPGPDRDTLRKRHRILQHNPELAIKEFSRIEEAQASLVDLVHRRLTAQQPDDTPGRSDDEASMVVSLAFGVLHYLMRHWITGGLPSNSADSLHRAIDLARRIATS